MGTNKKQEGLLASPQTAPPSRALEWLWAHFRDVPHPHILDCGPTFPLSINIFLRRGAKLYQANLITPARREPERFWKRERKTAVFLTEEFLAQLPVVPGKSLSAAFAWHLLDMLPREALPVVVGRLVSFLQPGGALFFLLREPYLAAGVEIDWWLENLTTLGSSETGREPFPYPALTNREVERLLGSNSVKTFLTRQGRREVLAIK